MQAVNETYTALKQEVADLKKNNSVAIESFEKDLQELTELLIINDLELSPDLNDIEVFTMEETPSLTDSIRKITL